MGGVAAPNAPNRQYNNSFKLMSAPGLNGTSIGGNQGHPGIGINVAQNSNLMQMHPGPALHGLNTAAYMQRSPILM